MILYFVVQEATSQTQVAHPFSVTLEWNHNHPVNSLQACNFKDIPPNVVEEVNSMYERGLTPACIGSHFAATS